MGPAQPPGQKAGFPGGAGGTFAPGSRQLRRGSRGSDVVVLQSQLNFRGASLKQDGIFGPLTNRAVRSFQRTSGLAADGVVGRRTWGALGIGSGVKVGTPGPASAPPAAGPGAKFPPGMFPGAGAPAARPGSKFPPGMFPGPGAPAAGPGAKFPPGMFPGAGAPAAAPGGKLPFPAAA
jgi:peptidoglycan hydrolase-like protein with peptidoglycan-binding domain